MRSEPTIDDLRKRLHAKQARVRRIAIADLLRNASDDALALALSHVEREPDNAIVQRIIDALGNHAFAPAVQLLQKLHNDPDTDAPIAHAALIACDRIERALRSDRPTGDRGASNAPDGS